MGSGSSKKNSTTPPTVNVSVKEARPDGRPPVSPIKAKYKQPSPTSISGSPTDHHISRHDDHHDDIPVVKVDPAKVLSPHEEEDFTTVVPPLQTIREESEGTVAKPYKPADWKPQFTVPVSLHGYRQPEPQQLSLDEVRPQLPWYRPEVEKEEFDWKEVEKDIQEMDEAKVAPKNLSAKHKSPRSSVTPRTVLINSPHNISRLSNRPVVTASGRKVSFMGQEKTRSLLSRRSDSFASLGGISINGIPRKIPPKKGTISFKKVDEQARSNVKIVNQSLTLQTTKEHQLSFLSLIGHLRQPVRFHKFSELMIARGLMVWLASQKISKSLGANHELATPKGILQLLAHGTITYSAAYAVLCREAGLQCVIIDGIARYLDFDRRTELEYVTDSWTAVYVESDWQIVHPYWICKGPHGLGGTLDDWIDRELENEGENRTDVVAKLKSTIKHFINEDYFMPNPEMFIYSNYADNIRWQLLPMEYTVKSQEEFLALPILFPAFFRFGLKLLTEPSCVLYSKNGKVKIWFMEELGCSHQLTLLYDLYLLESKCPNTQVLVPHLNHLVLHCRHSESFYFEIRLPIEGTFRLDIQGGYHHSHSLRLCQFKIICEERMKDFSYVPYDPDVLMWGPGPTCNDYGLDLPSKPTGIVKIFPQPTTFPPNTTSFSTPDRPAPVYKQRQFIFQKHPDKSKCMEYSVEMIGHAPGDKSATVTPLDENGKLTDKSKDKKKATTVTKQDYSFCVDCYTLQNRRQLIITVDVPHEGDFALVMKAVPFTLSEDKSRKEYGDAVPICVYLLRTFYEPSRENVHQKLARSELQSLMFKGKADDVSKAVEKCERVKIEAHDDEVTAGRARAEYLHMRKEIFDAIHRRNYRVICDQLIKLSKYCHKGSLVEETRKLFTLRNQLRRLLVFPQYIPELRRAGDELIYMEDPPPEVHITLGALFLLLEEPERVIENWSYITKQLSNESIYKKMYVIAELMPSKHIQRKIMTLLAEFNYAKVKEKSVAAAKFYVWVQKVMGVFQDIDFDAEPDKTEEKDTNDDDTENGDVDLTATKHTHAKKPRKAVRMAVNSLEEEDL